jgi:histidine triad (HIT) family protein
VKPSPAEIGAFVAAITFAVWERFARTRLIDEDDQVVAFRDIRPVAPIHVLIVPRKHIAAVHDMTADDVDAIGKLLLATRRVAETLELVKDGFRLVVNDGDAAGQTVHHLHVHVLGGRALH